MKILGISTAGKITGAALIDDEKTIAEFSSEKIKSEDLVVLIERILNESQLDIKDIEAISVCKGPGSYSGLRGGLAAAKSFAQVLNIPLVSVSTLHAIAYNLKYVKGTILVILDGTRSEVNLAIFSSDSINLKRMTKDLVVTGDRAMELIGQITGEINIISNVVEITSKNICNMDSFYSIPHAANAAKIGFEKIKAHDIDNYLTLVPKYSHMPNVKQFNPHSVPLKRDIPLPEGEGNLKYDEGF